MRNLLLFNDSLYDLLFRGPCEHVHTDPNLPVPAVEGSRKSGCARFVAHFNIVGIKSKQFGMHHRERRQGIMGTGPFDVPIFPPAQQLILKHWSEPVPQRRNSWQIAISEPDSECQIQADDRRWNSASENDSGSVRVAFDIMLGTVHPE